jgi:hypothetical protein
LGQEVARLPRSAAVGPRTDSPDAFGAWFARERKLRGIPLEWVSLHTKLAMPRLRALEAGCDPLGCDRSGRAAARSLAQAIGADPDEAAGRLSDAVAATARLEAPPAPVARGVALPHWTPALLLALVAAGAAWGLLAFLETRPAPAPDVVFRTDYVERLRESDGK